MSITFSSHYVVAFQHCDMICICDYPSKLASDDCCVCLDKGALILKPVQLLPQKKPVWNRNVQLCFPLKSIVSDLTHMGSISGINTCLK